MLLIGTSKEKGIISSDNKDWRYSSLLLKIESFIEEMYEQSGWRNLRLEVELDVNNIHTMIAETALVWACMDNDIDLCIRGITDEDADIFDEGTVFFTRLRELPDRRLYNAVE